jgi:hypothetical protein
MEAALIVLPVFAALIVSIITIRVVDEKLIHNSSAKFRQWAKGIWIALSTGIISLVGIWISASGVSENNPLFTIAGIAIVVLAGCLAFTLIWPSDE